MMNWQPNCGSAGKNEAVKENNFMKSLVRSPLTLVHFN
jgi:hypothetical protein